MKVPATQASPVVLRQTEAPDIRAAGKRNTARSEAVTRSAPAAVAADAARRATEESSVAASAEALRQELATTLENSDDLSVSFDRSTGRIVIRLVDPESGEVTRQIPPEEVLKVARRLKNLLPGLLVNRKV